MRPPRALRGWTHGLAILGLTLLLAGFASPDHALAQSNQRGVFVANNGNLEGSITAFQINEDGTLTLVNRIITGTRPSTSDPCPGCNPYEISITPNGKYLATGHASTNDPMEQITVFEVASDGSISQIGAYSVLGTPMDVQWITDQYLAVIRTETTPDDVVIYRFDPAGPFLTEIDAEDAGTFCGYLAVHPNRQFLYVNDSGSGRLVRTFAVASDGNLTLIDSEGTGSYYALELTLTHEGTKLYAAGGITYVVLGFSVAPDGTLSPMAGSPFPQSGTSPSNVYCSSDDRYLLVGHGTDATLRSAAIDPLTGSLTYTGAVFDVGMQGTLGDVATLDDFLFVTDNSSALDGLTGIYSFTLESDGSFTQNAPIYPTGGIAPSRVAAWKPRTSDVEDRFGTEGPETRVSPNPSFGASLISYRVPREGMVTIEVLDVTGRVVRVLMTKRMAAGEHSIAWDGTNDAGRRIGAGVYFVRVCTHSGGSAERVVIVR